MRRFCLFILLIISFLSSNAQDTWTQKTNFGGTARIAAVGFSIGTKGYIGTGNNGAPTQDFWEWNQATNSWTQKADFGGGLRYHATGFSIGTKGYIGTGDDGSSYKQDFWEWNQTTNTWTQKVNFGGTARRGATGFSIGAKGYIGTGVDGSSFTKDFWEYDPTTNAWTQKANFGGTARMFSCGFSTGTKGYIGTGWSSVTAYNNDFWEYDPIGNSWTQKANFGGTGRYAASAFSLGTKGYIGTGYDGTYKQDFWEYNPSTGSWVQRLNLGGTARAWTGGFSVGEKGYIGIGDDGSAYKKDFWEWSPPPSKLNSYEYWFDNNYSSRVNTNISPVADYNLNTTIPTNTLTAGLHTVHVRFRNDNSAWSSSISQFFQKIPVTSITNHKIISYEYWYDNNYNTKVSQSVSAQSSVQVISALSASALTDGLHSFHMRFKDDGNTWSSAVSQFFQKIPTTTVTNHKVIAYEYWYDNNYNSKVFQSVSAQSQVQVISALSASTLTDGLHTFHMRFKDDGNTWSSAVSQFFQKIPATSITNHQIVSYEYWYDNNYTSKISQSVSPQSQVQVISALSASALTDGLHTFHMRFKDDANAWSSAVSQFFQKIPVTTNPNLKITAYQYWFDTNFGSRVTQSVSPQSSLQVVTGIAAGSLTSGLHVYHVRFEDDNGHWSSALSQFFQKFPAAPSIPKLITAYRYWIDTSFASAKKVNLSVPVDPYQLLTNIDMSGIRKGSHVIHFQFRDTLKKWSVAVTDTFNKKLLLIPNFSANNTSFCDNGTVSFSNTSVDGDTYLWNFGDGTTSTSFSPSHTYTAAGTFSVQLTIKDTASGKDSTLALSNFITVTPTPPNAVTVIGNTSICQGSSMTLSATAVGVTYLWSSGATTQNIIVSSAGNYSVALSVNGCTSHSNTYSITVIANPPVPVITSSGSTTFCSGNSITLSSSSANSYLWSNGLTSQNISVNAAGNYSVVVGNSFGCKTGSSIKNVTVNPVPLTPTITASGPTTFCMGSNTTLSSSSGSSYLWNNGATVQSIAVNTAGNYSVTVSNGFGCTSSSSMTNIVVHALPGVTASIATDTFCVYSPVENLSGIPAGGIWSGAGVSGNVFNPNVAGAGLWNIVYTYFDANSCSNADTLHVYVDLCTGANELLGSINISVYPNPSFGKITVETASIVADQILISDEIGNAVLRMKPTTSKCDLNIGQLAAGTYFLTVRSTAGIYHSKIIKE